MASWVSERSPQWMSWTGVPVVIRVRVDRIRLPARCQWFMAAGAGCWAKRLPMTMSWVWSMAMGL